MSNDFNRTILKGRLTRDIELRKTTSGTSVTEIGLAINERQKVGGEWTDVVTYVDCTLWGKTAEVAEKYLSKGDAVLIEGRLKFDTWEKGGQKRSKLSVVGERLMMLGGKSDGGNGGKHAASTTEPPTTAGIPDDDIPF